MSIIDLQQNYLFMFDDKFFSWERKRRKDKNPDKIKAMIYQIPLC